MDHEGLSELTIHGIEQRNAHDQSIGQSGEREESDKPIQASVEEDSPKGEQKQDEKLGESVGEKELGVHAIRIVLGDEMERQHRNGEDCHEPVDAGALRRREDVAPFHRPITHHHRKV